MKKVLTFCNYSIIFIVATKKKRGDKMSPRTGRPKSDNSKDVMFRVRLDKDMVEKLEKASENLDITKSDVVRNGIESEYQRSIKK